MRDCFVRALTELAAADPNIMLLTGDLGFRVSSLTLRRVSPTIPQRRRCRAESCRARYRHGARRPDCVHLLDRQFPDLALPGADPQRCLLPQRKRQDCFRRLRDELRAARDFAPCHRRYFHHARASKHDRRLPLRPLGGMRGNEGDCQRGLGQLCSGLISPLRLRPFAMESSSCLERPA